QLYGEIEYRTDLFESITIERFIKHLRSLLESITLNPESPISSLSLLEKAEEEQILKTWNNTRRDYPRDKSIVDLFEQQVTQHPHAIALTFEGVNLSYDDLNLKSNNLAWALHKAGVQQGMPVAICGERSAHLIVGILAILKAGGAYVPLDAQYPKERLQYMLQDTGAKILIVQNALAEQFSNFDIRVLDLEGDYQEFSSEPLPIETHASDTAYIMYTSGSTGVPKGIAVNQRSVVRLVKNSNYVLLDKQQRILQYAPISFDAATFEIWGALLNGGQLILAPPGAENLDQLANFLVAQKVTTLWLTAALFHYMSEYHLDSLQGLQQLLAGGDVLAPHWVRKVLQSVPGIRLVNGYGPTENTTFTCCYVMTEGVEFGRTIPIGKPVANTQVYILDQQQRPVPWGLPGELYTAGDGVAQGYLNQKKLTASAFISNPYAEKYGHGPVLYRTGDKARYLSDGTIEFLGRIDQQVKIRGYRIEPGEIENCLRQQPQVQDALVLVKNDRLLAYIKGPDELKGIAWRQQLKKSLPEYMLPSDVIVIEAWPLTPNGKVDRAALLALLKQSDLSGTEAYVAPRNEIEEKLAVIWVELLGRQKVSVKDNFFEIGGHSLLATRVIARCRELFQTELPLRTLFEDPTIENLALSIEQSVSQANARLAPIDKILRDQPIPLSFAQQRLWFIEQLNPGSSAYNMGQALRIKGRLDVALLQKVFQTIVTRHEILRTHYVSQADGEAIQIIADIGHWPLVVTDIATPCKVDKENSLVQAEAIVTEASNKPFDLSTGPVFRTELFSLADNDFILLISMHHIVSDGLSMEILVKEIIALYTAYKNNQPPLLPALPIQYADFAAWQRKQLNQEKIQSQLAFWKQALKGAPELLTLPTDRPRPAKQTQHGDAFQFEISGDTMSKVKQLARANDMTLFMALLAGFQLLLGRYAQQDDVCVGIPVSGRDREETVGLIGFFINALIMRGDLRGNPSVEEFLTRVKHYSLNAFENQDLPSEMITEVLDIRRNAAFNPGAQVGFGFLEKTSNAGVLGKTKSAISFGEGADRLEIEPFATEHSTSIQDITLYISETGQGYTGSLEYNTDLFDKKTMEQMVVHYQYLLEEMAAHPKASVHVLAIESKEATIHQLGLEPGEIDYLMPLSFVQKDLYLDSMMHPDSTQNSHGYTVLIDEKPELDRWRHALELLVQHEPVLRTELIPNTSAYGELVYQCALKNKALPIEYVDLRARNLRSEEFHAFATETIYRPYKLGQEDWIKHWLFHLSDNCYAIGMSVHHIMLDGVGIAAHWHKLSQLYENNKLPEDKESFAAYLLKDRQDMDREETLKFWAHKFSKVEPLSFTSPITESNRACKHIIRGYKEKTVPETQWAVIKKYCKANRITPALFFKCIYGLLVKQYCRAETDFELVEYMANRTNSNIHNIGVYYLRQPFIVDHGTLHSLVNFTDLTAYAREFQKSIKGQTAISITQQLNMLPRGPLSFAYNFYNFIPAAVLCGKTIELTPYDAVVDNAIQFIANQQGETLTLTLKYDQRYFADYEFLDRVLSLSEQIISGEAQTLGELNYLLADEAKQQTLAGPSVSLAGQRSVQQLFEQQAQSTADAPAVICGDNVLSYAELNRRANQLAHYLREHGVERNSRVAICLNRSVDMLVALLSVLKAGGAYVPMDSEYPRERLAYMLRDSAAAVLITHENLLERLPVAGNTSQCFSIDQQWPDIAAYPDTNPKCINEIDDLMYVIYTSGSTGEPKGAAVKHRGEINLLNWYTREFAFNPDNRTLVISAFGFDLTQKNLLAPLVSGGQVILPEQNHYDDRAIAQLIKAQQITLINCAPSAFYPLVEKREDQNIDLEQLQSLRHVIFGGEPIRMGKLQPWLQHHTFNAEIINNYGPTECTDIAAFYRIKDPLAYLDKAVPLGQPNDNVQLYILNDDKQPVPPGLVGELCISGEGVGAGYLNKAELTNSVFQPNPFVQAKAKTDSTHDSTQDKLLYRSGDLVRCQAGGPLEFIGRKDFQVKIRGLRIELGEIEYALRQQAQVQDALVLAQDDTLMAYVTGPASLNDTPWREQLKNHLPDYMVPSNVVVLASWPLTPNGKIDRKALPKADAHRVQEYIAPRNELEERLAAIWAELLGLERVGVKDNFFEIGGHSLLATRVIARCRETFQIEIPLRNLFDDATLENLAKLIEQALTSETTHAIAPRIEPVSRDKPLPLSFAQQRLWFIDQMNPGNTAYNIPVALRLKGKLNVKTFGKVMTEIIRRHEVLRTAFINTDQGPVQKILDPQSLQIEQENLQQLPEDRRESEALKIAEQFSRIKFKLEEGALIRCKFLSLYEDDWILLINMHHIIADGWSLNILLMEVGELYKAIQNNQPSRLSEPVVQYADFSVWQRQWLQGDVLDQQLAYWKKQLAGAPDFLRLPTDHPRPKIQTLNGAHYIFNWDKDFSDQINKFCLQQNVTLFMTLLGVYQVLLSRYTGQQDICVGVPIAGRHHAQTESLIGLFVNALVMRTKTDGNPSVMELLQIIKQNTLDGFEHQDLPAEMLLDELNLVRNPSYSPGAQVGFQLQNIDISRDIEIPGELSITGFGIENVSSKYDITMIMRETAEGISGALEYNTDLFNEATIEKFAKHYRALLAAFIGNADAGIDTLTFVQETELKNLIQSDAAKTVTIETVMPLTAMQRDFYLHSQINPNTLENCIGTSIEINAEMDQALCQSALEIIAESNGLLRTIIVESPVPYGDVAYQCVTDKNQSSFEFIDFSSNGEYSPQDAQAFCQAFVFQPYDFGRSNLIRHALIKLNDKHYFLVFAAHHMIMDGLGMAGHGVAFRDTYEALLKNKKPHLDAPEFPQYVYNDIKQVDKAASINYWKGRAQYLDALDYPKPLNTNLVKMDRGRVRIETVLADNHWADVKKFCRKHKITPPLYFKALYGLLIAVYCRPESGFNINEMVSSRLKVSTGGVGCFVRQQPFIFEKNQMRDNCLVNDYFQAIRDEQKALNGLKPHISVRKQLEIFPQGRLGFTYNFYHFVVSLNLLGLDRPSTQYFNDIEQVHFIASLKAGQLLLSLHYLPDRFEDLRFLDRVLSLSEQIISGEAQTLGELNYLLADEAKQQTLAGP
ncbi:MAG TPA: amino acid adenylation domain-containing protein, partial [Pseudomonadales bacterium]